MLKTTISGAYTLLMTPFSKDLSLDKDGLRVLVRTQVEAGVHGLAPLGETGESPALSTARKAFRPTRRRTRRAWRPSIF